MQDKWDTSEFGVGGPVKAKPKPVEKPKQVEKKDVFAEKVIPKLDKIIKEGNGTLTIPNEIEMDKRGEVKKDCIAYLKKNGCVVKEKKEGEEGNFRTGYDKNKNILSFYIKIEKVVAEKAAKLPKEEMKPKGLAAAQKSTKNIEEKEAELAAAKISRILQDIALVHPNDFVSLKNNIDKIKNEVSTYLIRETSEEKRDRMKERLSGKLKNITETDETAKEMLNFTGILRDGRFSTDIGTTLDVFYDRYETIATAIYDFNKKLKDYITLSPSKNSEDFWNGARALKGVIDSEPMIAERILQRMYGKNGEMIIDLGHMQKESVYETYMGAVNGIINGRTSINKEISMFATYKPISYAHILTQTNKVQRPSKADFVYDKWDLFSMLEVVGAHNAAEGAGKVLTNVSDQEFLQMLNVMENAPGYLQGYMFSKQGAKFTGEVWLKIREMTDRLSAFSTVAQHMTMIYNMSNDHSLILNYLDRIFVSTQGSFLEELKGRTIESTAQGKIKIKSPELSLREMGVATDLPLDMASQWNTFLMDLNIEDLDRSYDESVKFLYSGLSVYFPEPNYGEPNLRLTTGIGRLLIGLDSAFREITLKIKQPKLDLGEIYGKVKSEPGQSDTTLGYGATGAQGARAGLEVRDYYTDQIDKTGAVTDKTTMQVVNMQTNNTYAAGMRLYDSFVNWSETKSGPVETEKVGSELNSKLNAMSNGSNIVFTGHMERDKNGSVDKGKAYFDVYVLKAGNWYRAITDNEFDKNLTNEFTKDRYFLETVRENFMAGIEPTTVTAKDTQEQVSKYNLGYYFGLVIPGGVEINKKSELKWGGIAARSKTGEMGTTAGKYAVKEGGNVVVNTASWFILDPNETSMYDNLSADSVLENYGKDSTYSQKFNNSLKWEMLVLDKMRWLAFGTWGEQSGNSKTYTGSLVSKMQGPLPRAGAGLETRNWYGGAIWNFKTESENADLFISAGGRDLKMMGMKTNVRAYYMSLQQKSKEGGLIAKIQLDNNRWISVYGKVTDNTVNIKMKNAGEIAERIDTLKNDFESNYDAMTSDKSFEREKMKSYSTEVVNILKSIREYLPWMLSGGTQVAGLGYVDITKGVNTKVMISKIPATEGNEVMYGVGMLDIKGVGFIVGIPATQDLTKISAGTSATGTVDILDFIGARAKLGEFAVAVWAGNMLVNKDKATEAWGEGSSFAKEKPFGLELAKRVREGVVGLTYTKPKENAYIVEGYMGPKIGGWRVGIDFGEIDKLRMYGVSATVPISSNLFLKSLLSYGQIKDSDEPSKELNQIMSKTQVWWLISDSVYATGNLNVTKTYNQSGMDYPTIEGYFKIQYKFGPSGKREKKVTEQ